MSDPKFLLGKTLLYPNHLTYVIGCLLNLDSSWICVDTFKGWVVVHRLYRCSENLPKIPASGEYLHVNASSVWCAEIFGKWYFLHTFFTNTCIPNQTSDKSMFSLHLAVYRWARCCWNVDIPDLCKTYCYALHALLHLFVCLSGALLKRSLSAILILSQAVLWSVLCAHFSLRACLWESGITYVASFHVSILLMSLSKIRKSDSRKGTPSSVG